MSVSFYVFAIASLGVYRHRHSPAGLRTRKYPFLGGVRSSSQMISYELSLGLAVIPIFLLVGQLRLTTIVRYQIEHGWMIAPFIGDWLQRFGNGSSPSRCSFPLSFS
jgi:NADH-quinone oxidoreductase subunit H